jgi:hypothetical protein
MLHWDKKQTKYMHKILTLGLNVNIFKFETKTLKWSVVDLTMLLISTPYMASTVLFYMKGGGGCVTCSRAIYM